MNLLSPVHPHLFHTSTSRVAVFQTISHLTGFASYTRPDRCGRQLLVWQPRRCLHADLSRAQDVVPFRKRLKDEAKIRKAALGGSGYPTNTSRPRDDVRLKQWELTVGIEIHAELNTARKLFSPAATSISDEPNSHVAHFDAALPGSQPVFQRDTLLPALRAAIALNCEIQPRSTFDRKHYFYQDQPAGYQITQYYEPFARNGHLVLSLHDGIAPEDGPTISVPIKQIQMEQDTAKTLHQPPSTYLLDFNRVSHPLIEIISMPAIHHPATAAAYVRKVQSILKSVNACTAGMELGGLRADVNVSIRRRQVEGQQSADSAPQHAYASFTGLGQRTEIKNLSSFKAVEDAIIAERDRQIGVLEAGGVIEGETRGFTIGSSETRRLRGKEGEIDYRYMPDPDISPIFIGDDLLRHLRDTLPALPDTEVERLVALGVTPKDARTLVTLDEGDRLEFYYDVLHSLEAERAPVPDDAQPGKMVANWVIHELGSHLTASSRTFSPQHVPASQLAVILAYLSRKEITSDTARSLFARIFGGEEMASVAETIETEGLRLQPLSNEMYDKLAMPFIDANPDMVKAIKIKGQEGKVMWFVGQMMRSTDEGKAGRLEAKRAELAIRRCLST